MVTPTEKARRSEALYYDNHNITRRTLCDRVVNLESDMEEIKNKNARLRAKLRELVPELCEQNAALHRENAKLRELVRNMWFWGYEGHMDNKSQEWQMKHIDGVLDRMRELGMEAS